MNKDIFVIGVYIVIFLIAIYIGYNSSNSDIKGIINKYEEAISEYNERYSDSQEEFKISERKQKGFKYQSKGEYKCQEVLENYFKKPFVNVRPKWLKNPETMKCLELDCYNEEVKVALEYNGIQHYKFPNGISKSKEDFDKQVSRDNIKKVICEARGVILIVVPYTIKHDNIENFIIDSLKKYNL